MIKITPCAESVSAVLETLGECYSVLDAHGNIVFRHDAQGLLEAMGLASVTGLEQLTTDATLCEVVKLGFERTRDSSRVGRFEYTLQAPDSRVIQLIFVALDTQTSSQMNSVAMLIKEREALQRHTAGESVFESIFKQTSEALIVLDSHHCILFANDAVSRTLGYHQEIFMNKGPDFLLSLLSGENRDAIASALNDQGNWEGEVLIARAGDDAILVWLAVESLHDGQNDETRTLVRFSDISQIERSREQLEYMATHDALTRLPNRVLLFDRLAQSVRSSHRSGTLGALLFIDIDDFKEVNDVFGHHVGDMLLQTIAGRIRDSIRSSDTVGRFGGDEFLLIAENIHHFDEVLIIIQKLREQFEVPLNLNGILLKVTFSIGVAMIPDDGDDAEALVSAADKAMYAVKQKGKDGFEFVKKEHSIISNEYFHIQRWTKNAIRTSAFELVYQPQFSIKDGRVNGVEALLRCKDEHIKDMPIHKIITIAEESGAIYDIGKFVLESVCRQLDEWRDISTTPFHIAINLSRKELGSSRFESSILEGMKRCNLQPAELEFEITESTLMHNGSEARKNIDALRDIGFRFSIDDFGTGYSSLSNLKEFDLDKLKIDKSFIDALDSDVNDQAIVSATISMAKKLGLTVVAEGVETSVQDELLKALECDEVQGYFYSHPVLPDAITDLLRARNA